jgi:uncharacterized protein YbbK (DUF523 family)
MRNSSGDRCIGPQITPAAGNVSVEYREVAHVEGPIRVGISSCLLGEAVRYDGGHKRADFLFTAFGQSVEWVPVCPEVEAGFGTPREPVQLARGDGAVRLVTVTTRRDLTASMDEFISRRVPELRSEELSGYVLKANSPSCGPGQVKIFDQHGVTSVESGRGLFADALIRQFPELPIEDEGRLADPRLLEDFVRRVFAYSLTSSPGARFPPARRF